MKDAPAALGSEWVALERSTVLFRDPTNQGRRFVPLLLADCTLPDTLRRYKYVDFRQETPTAFDELLAACRVEAEAAPPGCAGGDHVAGIQSMITRNPAYEIRHAERHASRVVFLAELAVHAGEPGCRMTTREIHSKAILSA